MTVKYKLLAAATGKTEVHLPILTEAMPLMAEARDHDNGCRRQNEVRLSR